MLGWGSEQPGLVEDVPACCSRAGLGDLSKSLPTKPFSDPMLENLSPVMGALCRSGGQGQGRNTYSQDEGSTLDPDK